MMLGIISVNNC